MKLVAFVIVYHLKVVDFFRLRITDNSSVFQCGIFAFCARDCAHNDAFVHQAVHKRPWLCV